MIRLQFPLASRGAPVAGRAVVRFEGAGIHGEAMRHETIAPASHEDHMRRFLGPEDAAEYLGGLNSRTVTRWAREGYLPAYPIGEGKRRLWRFLESDLERWMLARGTGDGTLLLAADASSKGVSL
ncbi:MAG: helix-turn-helix domain-containing protein [Bryobacteraceae bacterium]